MAAAPGITSDLRVVDKLTGPDNYPLWKLQMKGIFAQRNLWDVVSGPDICPPRGAIHANETVAQFNTRSTQFDLNQRDSFTAIILTVEQSQGMSIIDESLGSKAWRILEERNQPTGSSMAYTLLQDFNSQLYDPNEGVDIYVNRLKHLAVRLASVGSVVPETILCSQIANGMPTDSYTACIDAYFSSNAQPSVESLIAALKGQERRIKSNFVATEQTRPSAFNTNTRGGQRQQFRAGKAKGSGPKGQGKRPFNINSGNAAGSPSGSGEYCQFCRKYGHKARNCWKLFPELKEEYENRRKQKLPSARSALTDDQVEVAEADMPVDNEHEEYQLGAEDHI